MAQYNAPFPSSPSPDLIAGTPAVLGYGRLLLELLPSIYAQSLNEALEDHVSKTRRRLEHDDDYAGLAEYYDVVHVKNDSDSDEGITLDFGFFGVPTKLHNRVVQLEYGDANQPPRAFVRRTVFKHFDDVIDALSLKVNHTIGTSMVDA